MFCVGLELPLAVLQLHWKKSLTISLAGIALPFLLGGACGVAVDKVLPAEKGSLLGTVLFSAVVTSITAFPVLARILAELRIMDTNAGATAMNAAAVDDVIAWCILAVVLAVVRSSAPITALYTVLSTLAVVLVLALLVRPALAWVFDWLEERRGRDSGGAAAKATQLVIVVGKRDGG